MFIYTDGISSKVSYNADVLRFLTEIWIVAGADLDNATNGYVARGGAMKKPLV